MSAVLDASVLVAIMLREDGWEAAAAALNIHRGRLSMSPVNAFEALVVAASRRPGGDLLMRRLMEHAGVEIVAIAPSTAERAFAAHLRFGKGRHPAKLNLGDCFAYALAIERGEPLLFVGDDFAKTDVTVA